MQEPLVTDKASAKPIESNTNSKLEAGLNQQQTEEDSNEQLGDRDHFVT